MILKKILVSVLLALIATNGFTKERVVSMWPFTPASTQGTYFRAILEQANKEQDKYDFVFENKTGAGGAIATQYIASARTGTRILAHSSAYFIRPFLYSETQYNFEQFKPLMIMGFAPAALITKGKTLDQILAQKKINIATAGAGTSTHLFAEAFFKQYKEGRDIAMVHYRDSNEAAKDVIGGQADASFEFLGDAKARGDLVNIIGITGKSRVENFRLLPGMEELVSSFAIYVPKDMPTPQVTELQTILLRAEKHESVQVLYRRDYNYKDSSMNVPGDLTTWYSRTVKQFEVFTKGIKVN
jgi:tripartite-type tricarboxylate transporter receptor subunit TctC